MDREAARSIQSRRDLRCSASSPTTSTPIQRPTPPTNPEWRKSATALGINYPVLLGGDSISEPYGGLDGVCPTPFTLIAKGWSQQQIVGLADRDEIEANIKKAIASGGE